jgi:hypothetical protein
VGILTALALSGAGARGILLSVRRWFAKGGPLTVGCAALWLAAGCDIRPLTARDLFGAADAASIAASDAATDAASDAATDAVAAMGDAPDGAGSDIVSLTCATSCAATQFCDDLTGRCTSRTGTSMLSGVVRDQCTGMGIDALVGIAGHHQCSPLGKGAYYFSQLPLGRLTLAVAKDGYHLFDTVVDIAPGGNTLDVDLVRAAPEGCAGAAPPISCSCVAPACAP